MESSNNFSVTFRAPSNIALVKYWGKYGDQLACNDSISFTLNKSYTNTKMEFFDSDQLAVEYHFEGVKNEQFGQRVLKYIQKLSNQYEKLSNQKIIIHSENTFPHSAGIASSASSFASLALGIGSFLGRGDDYEFISHLARLGSGSASRSIFPYIARWNHAARSALPITEINNVFRTFQDSILIVDSSKKAVSSGVGHSLMENHLFKEKRFAQANSHTAQMVEILKTGDLESFIKIVEEEALTLHAMMMTSRPSFILMKPSTLTIIDKIRNYRNHENIPLCFTLDAGPNIHLLYPAEYKDKVGHFIETELLSFTENNKWIQDEVGPGPVKL